MQSPNPALWLVGRLSWTLGGHRDQNTFYCPLYWDQLLTVCKERSPVSEQLCLTHTDTFNSDFVVLTPSPSTLGTDNTSGQELFSPKKSSIKSCWMVALVDLNTKCLHNHSKHMVNIITKFWYKINLLILLTLWIICSIIIQIQIVSFCNFRWICICTQLSPATLAI